MAAIGEKCKKSTKSARDDSEKGLDSDASKSKIDMAELNVTKLWYQ